MYLYEYFIERGRKDLANQLTLEEAELVLDKERLELAFKIADVSDKWEKSEDFYIRDFLANVKKVYLKKMCDLNEAAARCTAR